VGQVVWIEGFSSVAKETREILYNYSDQSILEVKLDQTKACLPENIFVSVTDLQG
jgi:hypothetical protein